MFALSQGPKFLIGAVSVLSLLAVAGCQTTGQSLSIGEARRVTSQFSGKAFTPPPRSVTDITSILEKQAQDDLEGLKEARKLADTQPPVSVGVGTLATFYHKRAQAARKLGRSGQEVADFRLAFDNAREYRDADLMDEASYLLALAQVLAGSFSQAIDSWQQAIQVSKGYGWGDLDLAEAYAMLADIYAKAGDPEGVKQAVANSLAASRRVVFEYPEPGDREIKSAMKAWREASLHEIAGRYPEAEPLLHKAIKLTAKISKLDNFGGYDAIIMNLLQGNLADNLRKQGRLVEAEVVAREALTTALKMNGRYAAQTAYMLGRLTRVVFDQGRFSDAEVLARANIDAYVQSGVSADSLYYAGARIDLADALVAQGRWQEALAQYEQARDALAGDAYTTKKFVAGNVNWAIALLESGRSEEALDVLRDAEARLAPIYGQGHYALAEVAGFKAKAYAASGKQAQALEVFASSVPALLEGARRDASQGGDATTRTRKLRSILEAYIGLLADIRSTPLERQAGLDTAAESFRIADAARMHSVQRALSASGARAAVKDPDLADLVRREQDAKQQSDALLVLFTDMLAQPTAQRSAAAVASTRADIGRLQAARVSILTEIEARFPDYADLISPKPTTASDVQVTLNSDEALIATYVGTKRTFMWAVPKSGPVMFADAVLGREDLSDTVALLRSALEPNAQTLGDIPDFDVASAHDIYRQILVPVRAGWKDATSLLVVADAALGYLPLSLLPTEAVELGAERAALFENYQDVPWLARSHAVTMLPSVASLATLRGLPPGDAGRKAFAGFGDPYFTPEHALVGAQPTAALTSRGLVTRGLPVRLRAVPQTLGLASADLARLPRLPDTADEVRSIALALGADLTDDVLLGTRANEGAIKTMDLSGYKVLAFATHGLVPGDLDGLSEPALALSSPQVAGGDDDGLLTMGEILGLKLNADWVVLSACNTGSGQGAGAEAVSGLGRAFFYAGTRALLVSNWPVETTSAKALTTDVFRRQAEDAAISRAEALRQAMLAQIDGPGYVDSQSGKTVFSYAHPIFWAPFTLIGDGG